MPALVRTQHSATQHSAMRCEIHLSMLPPTGRGHDAQSRAFVCRRLMIVLLRFVVALVFSLCQRSQIRVGRGRSSHSSLQEHKEQTKGDSSKCSTTRFHQTMTPKRKKNGAAPSGTAPWPVRCIVHRHRSRVSELRNTHIIFVYLRHAIQTVLQ